MKLKVKIQSGRTVGKVMRALNSGKKSKPSSERGKKRRNTTEVPLGDKNRFPKGKYRNAS